MNSVLIANQMKIVQGLHPELARAAYAVYTEPEVQDALRVLGKYGLGVMLPHRHNEQDKMVPLPQDEIQSEERLKVTFRKKEVTEPYGVIVGWRSGPSGEIDFASECGIQAHSS